MHPKPALLLLVDGLAAPYLHKRKDSVINTLSREGVAAAVVAEPLYPGCDGLVYGVPPALHGTWLNYFFARPPFENDQSPRNQFKYYGIASIATSFLPRRAWTSPLRAALWRRQLAFHPHLLPPGLFPFVAPPPPPACRLSLFEQLEAEGATVRWYSRDCPFERHKHWGGTAYRILYGRRLLDWIRSGIEEADVVFAELSTRLDQAGHRSGPGSPAVDHALRQIDAQIGSLYRAFRRHHPDGLFLLLSDHGMSAVSSRLDVEGALSAQGLRWAKDYVAILHGTCAHAACPDGDALTQVEAAWRKLGNEVVDNGALEARGYPAGLGRHERLLVVPEGTVVSPNHFNGRTPMRGMHGYWSANSPASRAGFLLHGLGTGTPAEPTRMIDLHQLILDALRTGRLRERVPGTAPAPSDRPPVS